MVCEYCGGDVGETIKLLNGKVSCSACRVVMMVSGRSIFVIRARVTEVFPVYRGQDDRILEAINGGIDEQRKVA